MDHRLKTRKDKHGVDLISDALPFGRNRSHRALIRVYDEAGNVVATHEQAGDFKEW